MLCLKSEYVGHGGYSCGVIKSLLRIAQSSENRILGSARLSRQDFISQAVGYGEEEEFWINPIDCAKRQDGGNVVYTYTLGI